MDPRKKQKLILLGCFGVALGTLSITAVYLPFYHKFDHKIEPAEHQQKNSPKGMWKNIDDNAKGQRRF